MGFNFTIGKASVQFDEYDKSITPTVIACEGEPPHRDRWEMEPNQGVAWRMPSYGGWAQVLDQHPGFHAVWDRLEKLVKANDWKDFLPVVHYLDELDDLEQEALRVHTEASQRVLWFVRWSRQAHALYGNLAAFAVPGEWN